MATGQIRQIFLVVNSYKKKKTYMKRQNIKSLALGTDTNANIQTIFQTTMINLQKN